jgi:superfamily II DNA or RNA helicase
MATLRERNNLASKKSYEKSIEQRHAVDYEHVIVKQHRLLPHTQAWHWSDVPEDELFDAGYIHDFNQRRLNRLAEKVEPKEPGQNRLRDYGLDGLGKTTLEDGSVVYQALQAKFYHSKRVTAADIGSFLCKAFSMYQHNNKSKGYLYTTTRLQADLHDEVRNPAYVIKHVLHPWKPVDGRTVTAVTQPASPVVLERDLQLHKYQQDALAELIDGHNALTMPCRMGKTLVAGHWLQHHGYRRILAMAPMKISVDNLRTRFACFLPGYADLLVDSDDEGTTDPAQIQHFLHENADKPVIIYTTYQSALYVMKAMDVDYGTWCIIGDEIHHADEELCAFINTFRTSLCMSATFPAEVRERLDIDNVVKVTFATGIAGNYITDYKIWLPYVENDTIDITIASELADVTQDQDMMKKALFLATSMLGTGSRKVIVYHESQAACEQFMQICQQVFVNYHGLQLWTQQLTSDTASTQDARQTILNAFQEGSRDVCHVLNSVRILDEAVDIPACDSVFITSVGEASSDIRFLQRTQRASTIDRNTPNKINNIFVWASGFEQCLNAMSMLRDADPEFHKKLQVRDGNYEKSGATREHVQKQQSAFAEYVTMKCISYDDKMRKVLREYEQYFQDDTLKHRAPTRLYVTPDGFKLGPHFAHIKEGRNKDFYIKCLEQSFPVLKKAYEEAQQKRATRGTDEEIAQRYKTFVETENKAPPFSYVTPDGFKLGPHFADIKQGRNKDFYIKCLEQSFPVLKKAYEEAQQRRATRLTDEEIAQHYKTYDDTKNKAPPRFYVTPDGFKLGQHLHSIIQGHNKEFYDKYLKQSFPVLKKAYEEAQQRRATRLTHEEILQKYITYVETENKAPSANYETPDGFKLGPHFDRIKQGHNKDFYIKYLNPIPVLRKAFEKCQAKKIKKRSDDAPKSAAKKIKL